MKDKNNTARKHRTQMVDELCKIYYITINENQITITWSFDVKKRASMKLLHYLVKSANQDEHKPII